jgi:large subunit ribosomal protein L9
MKVILTQEVKGKGHEGDVVDVTRGYAVNYLLPRKMAIAATAGNLKQLDSRMSNIRKRNDERRSDAEGVAAALQGKTLVIEAKAGEEGKLFGSVTTLMIEEAIAAQLGHDVDHRKMEVERTIKTTGDHPVVVSVFGEVKAQLIVRVVGEGGTAQAMAAPVVVEVAAEADAEEAPAETAEETEVHVEVEPEEAEAEAVETEVEEVDQTEE